MRTKTLACSLLATLLAGGCSSTMQPRSDGEQSGIAISAHSKPSSARNVILFIGDGMSLDTVTAARILAGQQRGGTGEEHVLAFETLPQTALSKVYNTNQQVPDSAGTATAMLSGHKTLAGVIGVDRSVVRANCSTQKSAEVPSIVELAEQQGIATGIVTTARITHATPAAAYAHSADRGWESNGKLPADADGCTDIASQLVSFSQGDGIDIALGGGWAEFVPESVGGKRTDGINLLSSWEAQDPVNHTVVNNRSSLAAAVDGRRNENRQILGVFNKSHMSYEMDRKRAEVGEPSLTTMTLAAVKYLENKDSYFLLVEGGRIDHAHHMGNAARALTETIEFSQAIEATLNAVSLDDTLIIVTADHGHTMSMGGYSTRGNPILGKVIENGPDGRSTRTPALDINGQPYTSLSYANGPGYMAAKDRVMATTDTSDADFLQVAAVGLKYGETHSGTDVPVYSGGPGSQDVRGVMEQNKLFDIMAKALGLIK
ncbi:MAG: alkaline phosphatase [Gammaproteobacteria bacterium]